jgi:8-oxo-dGTP diphosphatase
MIYQQHISITVDGIIFTIHHGSLKILLIQRLIEPYKNTWALPWWFVLDDESLDQAISRELQEETNVTNTYLEQLYTFGFPNRDPRGRVVSCAYMALMRCQDIMMTPWSDAKDVQLFSIDDMPPLAFDHQEIVDYALKRLQYKLEYTNAAQYLLPSKFTLTELHQLYEIVFGIQIDIRNFKKKILKINILQSTGEKVLRGVHRPAMLYQFVTKDLHIVDIL